MPMINVSFPLEDHNHSPKGPENSMSNERFWKPAHCDYPSKQASLLPELNHPLIEDEVAWLEGMG